MSRDRTNVTEMPPPKLLGYECPVCKVPLPGKDWDHCDGSPLGVGYARKIDGAHHVRRVRGPNGMETQVYQVCFLCHAAMGCPLCSVHPICRRCLVIVDRDYFVRSGPLSNDSYSFEARGRRKAPTASAYPGSWVEDYILANPETWNLTDEELYLKYREMAIRFTRKTKMPRVHLSDKELERRRNEQVEQLQASGS